MVNLKKSSQNEATLQNLSPCTIESYWWHIQDFASFHNINPEQANADHLRIYLVSMLR